MKNSAAQAEGTAKTKRKESGHPFCDMQEDARFFISPQFPKHAI
jgi:hypothetical protein